MKKLCQKYLNIFEKVHKINQALIFIILSTILGVLFTEIVLRYILGGSLRWSYELSRYLFVWLVFLSAGIGFRKGSHMGLDMFVELLSEKKAKILRVITHLVLLIFVLWISYKGYGLIANVSGQISPGLRINMRYPYYSISIGSFIISLYIIEMIIKEDILNNQKGGK
jgi:TRAP-type C4-dicarboxylate transport system permease small subunit